MGSYDIGLYLGWLNIVALTALFLRYFEATLWKNNKKVRQILKKTHLFAAILLIVSALIHSSLVWGSPEFHTGQLLLSAIIVTVVLTSFGKRLKIIKWFVVHKIFAVVVLVFLLIHLYDVLFR